MKIKDILVLTMIKGFGPAMIKKNLGRLKKDQNYREMVKTLRPEELDNCSVFEKEAEDIIAICAKEGIEMIDLTSSFYPSSLMEISTPPAILYVKGNKSLLDRVIAIIGTRHSTDLGNKIAERLGEYFSHHFSICNGLVEGIDEHSIYVNGKIVPNVIGIISGGLCYRSTCSKNHVRVIDDVLNAGGLIISEYPPMKKEDQYAGGNSSRIQAGLSSGIILVQSKIGGGSKYTLDKFSKLGRTLGIVHFPMSTEYQSEVFEANRLIITEGNLGLAKFVGLKTVKTLNVKGIIPICSKDDYELFEDNLKKQTDVLNLF